MTTKLRREMDNAMVLRGFAPRTREAYLACVTALAQHYHRSPDGLDTAEIQTYLLHLIKEKKLAYASVNQAVCSFRFLFDAVLGHKTLALEIPMAKVPKRLPQILSREEVSRLFAATASLRARTVLMTTYAAGLRVSETCALQVADIESAPDRMCLKVRQGKGGQDRYAPKEVPLYGGHAALASAARHTAPVLARSSAEHVALSQPRRHGADRSYDSPAHVLRCP